MAPTLLLVFFILILLCISSRPFRKLVLKLLNRLNPLRLLRRHLKPNSANANLSSDMSDSHDDETYLSGLKTKFLSLKLGFAVLPSYLQILVDRSRAEEQLLSEGIKPRRLHKTSWLDGVRGVAALIVVVYHWFMVQPINPLRPYYLGPYEFPGSKKPLDPMLYTSPLQLPIIRLLFAGDLMVPIFFVVSGYVLSFRQVRLINSTNPESRAALLDLLFSSVVRRGLRLFLPTAATVVFVTFGAMLGLHTIYIIPPGLLSPITHIIHQILALIHLSWKVDVFTDKYQQFWTIPAEFTCSMILFIFTVGVCEMESLTRVIVTVIMMIWALMSTHWGVFCFFSGWLIAETEYLDESTSEKPRRLRDRAFWSAVLFLGCFLGSHPSVDAQWAPFQKTLLSITPRVYLDRGYQPVLHFWTAIAAVMIVWSLFRLPVLQNIFTTKIALYLGDISFSLYLVHFQLVVIHKDSVKAHVDVFFGPKRSTHLIRLVSWAYELMILWFITFWQADLCWRYVDAPSVRFSKWVETMVRRQIGTDGQNV